MKSRAHGAWRMEPIQVMRALLPAKIATHLGRLALCALLFALCSCEGHWEEVEKVTGYRGKARVNPFLAAERVLDELGHDAERKLFLSKMPSYDAVMFLSAEGGLSEGRTKQLLEWVENGGHLIYCLGGTRSYNDYSTGLELGMRVLNDVLVEEGDPLLRDLGIKVNKWDPKNIQSALKKIGKHFDLRPKGIIVALDLLRPIYSKTAAYGHFGRDEPEFTWEATDKAAALRSAAGLR